MQENCSKKIILDTEENYSEIAHTEKNFGYPSHQKDHLTNIF